jgi:hypothetical protein
MIVTSGGIARLLLAPQNRLCNRVFIRLVLDFIKQIPEIIFFKFNLKIL